MSALRAAKSEDELVEVACACGPVIVLATAADEWRCARGHVGTRGQSWEIAEQILTLDEYVPSLLRPVTEAAQ